MSIDENSSYRFLIVEDDPSLQALIELSLKKKFDGSEIFICQNGKDALELLARDQNISLIISDMLMPDMDGSRLAHMTNENSKLRNIPILVCSALDPEKTDVLKKLPENVKGYLRKPALPKMIAEKAEEIVRSHNASTS